MPCLLRMLGMGCDTQATADAATCIMALAHSNVRVQDEAARLGLLKALVFLLSGGPQSMVCPLACHALQSLCRGNAANVAHARRCRAIPMLVQLLPAKVRVHSALLNQRCFIISEQVYATSAWSPVLPFSKLNKMFFGYFDPENIFLDNENNQFSG